MKNILSQFFLFLLFSLLTNSLWAQSQPDSSALFRIETRDGNEYIGLVVASDSLKVELETSLLGRITLPRSSIVVMSQLTPESLKAGQVWQENPQSGRYFWSPNGYGLRKGEGYYQNIWVLWNQASIGVTDYFSIGAGMIPLFFFGGLPTPVWIVPKFSIPVVKDKFSLGAGAIAGTLIGENSSGVGIVYGLGTYGNRNNNLTLGLGYGYAGGEWSSSPVITLSGMARVGRKSYIITENYFIGVGNETVTLLSAGGRTIIKKAGFDYGLFIPLISGMDRLFAIPWLGFTVPLGKKY